VLFQEVQRHAPHTTGVTAQVSTLRERLLKVAVWVERSVRRIVLHLPSAFPWLRPWRQLAQARAAGEAEIHTLRVVGASAGRTAAIRLATAGPGRLVATSDLAPSLVMTLSAVPQDRAELVARQLPDLARHPLFRDCLEFARSMARALGG
jgi:hypothetical protein